MSENRSFLPDDYLEKRIARRTNAICLTLFAVVMCAVVAAFFVTDRQRSEIRAQQNEVNARFEEAARRLEQLDELRARKQQMLRKAEITAVLVERVPRSLMLAELINNMPSTLSFEDLALETKVLKRAAPPRTSLDRARQRAEKRNKNDSESQLPEVDVPETEMHLTLVGLAPSQSEVSDFMSALNRHDLFTNVFIEFSEQVTIEDTKMRRFKIHMQVRQDVPIHELDRTLVRRGLKQNPMGETIEIDAEGNLVGPQSERSPVADAPTR